MKPIEPVAEKEIQVVRNPSPDCSTPTAFMEFLITTPIEYFEPRNLTGQAKGILKNNVLCVSMGEKLPKVFRKLTTEKILSCPVVDASQRYMGFVDMIDLVRFVSDIFQETNQTWPNAGTEPKGLAVVAQTKKYQNTRAVDIMEAKWYSSKADPFHAVMAGYSLLHGFEILGRSNVHRIPILDPNSEDLVNILTQSMALSIVRQKLGILPEATLNFKVEEMLPFLSPKLITCQETDRVLDCFIKMSDNHISGLPVLDQTGALVDQLSIRDLRGVGIGGEKFKKLFSNVRVFCNMVRKEQTLVPDTHHLREALVPLAPLHVSLTDTLQEVITLMMDGNIHRIWVTKDSRPIAVISQGDLIMIILQSLGMLAR